MYLIIPTTLVCILLYTAIPTSSIINFLCFNMLTALYGLIPAFLDKTHSLCSSKWDQVWNADPWLHALDRTLEILLKVTIDVIIL